MAKKQPSSLKELQQLVYQFDKSVLAQRKNLLKQIRVTDLPIVQLAGYHDLLLFMLAHPGSSDEKKLVEKNLSQLTLFLKSASKKTIDTLLNTGLPHTAISTCFSHDLLEWLIQKKHIAVNINYTCEADTLLTTIKTSINGAERDLCSFATNEDELFSLLNVTHTHRSEFLIEQLSAFNAMPLVKDMLFDRLNTETTVTSKHNTFSRTYNRFQTSSTYYHDTLLKRFDHTALLQKDLPPALALTKDERNALHTSIKLSLTLMARETDPATYLDDNALYFYQLERGIAIALYGMKADRQLPFESYVGYTLFKNGLPAAYGGAWVFGKRALFGMNIFESFRGGESGYMMCQLLRTYHKAFGVSSFEVEPYQFGKDNPDGIKSGAFWFYFRFGFRPIDSKLHQLALTEHKKIQAKKGYFSSVTTLKKFTDSYLRLDIENTDQITIGDVTESITKHINKYFAGSRKKALQKALENFVSRKSTDNAIQEYALLALATNTGKTNRLQELQLLAELKPNNLFAYQRALLAYLNN